MKKHILVVLLLCAAAFAANAQCTADAGPSQVLTCITASVLLEGSSNVSNATYQWTGPSGFTSNTQVPITSVPGVYTLIISDPSNGCTATATTTVLQNTSPPSVNVSPPPVLNCINTQIVLDVSAVPVNCSFLWFGPGGFGSTTQNPTVSVPGVYTLQVVNPANGCTSTQDVVVSQDIAIPGLNAFASGLGCNGNINLFASSPNSGVLFHWIGPNGFTFTDPSPVIPNATNSDLGDYTVIVTAPNGCTNAQSVFVDYATDVPKADFAVTQVSCNGGNDGAISVTGVTGSGTPPYSYLWSNGATGELISNLSAGAYTVTLEDATGCNRVQTVNVTQPTALTAFVSVLNPSCNAPNSGVIVALASGGTPPYMYQWSDGFNQPTHGNLAPGTYMVTVTDAKGCTSTASATLVSPAPVIVGTTVICENSISVSASGGAVPYSFTWSNNQNTPTITNLPPGTYTVTVTDSQGCSSLQTFIISPNEPPCTRIYGQATWDQDENCVADTGEPGLTLWHLKAEGANGTFYGITSPDGSYEISVLPGDYTVSILPQGWQTLVCQNDIAVSLPQQGDSVAVNYIAQLPTADCPVLSVNLSVSLLRRCFSNNYYYIHYQNENPVAVPDAYLTLALDPFLELLSAQAPYTSLGNNLYRFDLGTLPPNASGTIQVQVKVSCDATLGQTHCTEVHIFPDSSCVPANAQWSGALVGVLSVCNPDSLRFVLKNIGQAPMSEALEYIVIEDGIMSLQGSGDPLGVGESMVVSVPANGSTWRIEANQEVFAPPFVTPVLSVEGCTTGNSFSTGFINQFSLGDDVPWLDLNCTPNQGSFDPNDKQGFPTGYGASHYVLPGTELEYLIRFQNTGTDTAFTVVIRDPLSTWLDPLTLRPGASSHPYTLRMGVENTLIFDFQNILLPDSNVNEAASHGFVQFRIHPRSDVALETDILNQAAIYFDFNDPVMTNTTLHRIGLNFVSVGLWQPSRPEYAVQVAPHPLNDASWITLSGQPGAAGDFTLSVYDLQGQLQQRLEASEPKFLLRKTQLSGGIYLFKIEQQGELLGSGKLLVR
ncbi:MAG: hypothetical protein IT260_03725 [Saprospiraceae bacterium]|nr:hypothetical protein [Saprospiraceae bacterium]